MLYEFQLSHYTMVATKNIWYAKDEDAVDNQMAQEISFRLQDPQQSGKVR